MKMNPVKKQLAVFSWKFHNTASICHYIMARLSSRRTHAFQKELLARSLHGAVNDAIEYLDVTSDDFFNLALTWPKIEEKLFLGSDTKPGFYCSWRGDDAASNICANIINQHFDHASFWAVSEMLTYRSGDAGVLDFGCGTASLSLGFKLAGNLPEPLCLADVNNDVKDFINFRITKHGLTKTTSFIEVSSLLPEERYSCLICVDVLEHLENPTHTFTKCLDPLIRVGGYLYLKAPWLGHLTHPIEAVEDFYGNGGRRSLGHGYRLVKQVAPFDIAGIWLKNTRQKND